MGYKGVETTEMVLDGVHVPAVVRTRGTDGRGKGFYQMMDGVEGGSGETSPPGACGISIRAFDWHRLTPAAQDSASRSPIIRRSLSSWPRMATKVEAAHLMMVNAARLKDAGERNDVEGRHGQLLASRVLRRVTQESFRIHGIRLLQGVRDRAAHAGGAVPAHPA